MPFSSTVQFWMRLAVCPVENGVSPMIRAKPTDAPLYPFHVAIVASYGGVMSVILRLRDGPNLCPLAEIPFPNRPTW